MSAYLMRLVARGRLAGGADTLQPFIRSRSPIAERDQRIGITGLEEIGSTAPSRVEMDAIPMPVHDAMVEPPLQSGIVAGGGKGEPDLRRKPESAVALTAGFSASTAAIHSASEEMHHGTPLRVSSTDIGDRLDPSVPVNRPSVALPERDVTPNLEPPTAVTDDIGSQDPIPADSEAGARSRLVRPVAVRRRSARDARQVDAVPRLEPSPRTFPDTIESSVAEAVVASADDSPRVVIDRVNVEVVPPPVSTETKAPSRPRPLTAESVSVIGPLGGNRSSRMAFGLRYR